MSTPPPVPCVYEPAEGVFRILARAHNIAAAHYGAGEVVQLVRHEERSKRSHDHFFAVVDDIFESLPEALAGRWVNVEHFRKSGLIATGFCSVEDYACGTRAEADRWRANLRKIVDPYDVVDVSGSVVRVFRARSQSIKAMGKADFQASKDAVLTWAAQQLGVEAANLPREHAA